MQKLDQGDYRHSELQDKLLTIKEVSGNLPPDTKLRGKEVRRIGQYPVGMSAQYDIWEGSFLGGEKVAIKLLRGVNAKPQQIKVGDLKWYSNNLIGQQRFHREAEIWRKVWEKDRGKHFLAYYGLVTDDGP
jgi:hypothetical protein